MGSYLYYTCLAIIDILLLSFCRSGLLACCHFRGAGIYEYFSQENLQQSVHEARMLL